MPNVSENLFQIWEDVEIGDPEFYRSYLVDFEKELASWSKQVKEDMDPELIDKIYQAAMKWTGLSYEVDEFRRRYLLDRLIEQGK